MTWKTEQGQSAPVKFKAIRCLTCEQDLPSRSYLKAHKNHDVVYINLDGSIA